MTVNWLRILELNRLGCMRISFEDRFELQDALVEIDVIAISGEIIDAYWSSLNV